MVAHSIKQRILENVRGSIPLTCAAFAADNVLATLHVTRPDPAPDEHLGGWDIEADLRYAKLIADMYVERAPDLQGRVAEIGPGGSAAVALHLLDQGCAQVDLVDRFEFSHDPAMLASVYDRIIQAKPKLSQKFGTRRDLEPHIRFFGGEDAAAEVFFQNHGGYDAIVSCAVLEHLYDPLRALAVMASALTMGGRLLHQVDLRDHGMFTAGGHHELTFLTIPGWFYPIMTKRRGRPNRVLIHRYRKALDDLGLNYELLVTNLVGIGHIEPALYDNVPEHMRQQSIEIVRNFRPRLASEFQHVSDEDLSIANFFLLARRER